MTTYTLQLAYALTSYAHRTVEADNPEDACQKALAALDGPDGYDGFKDDAEGSSATYVAGMIKGEAETIYDTAGERVTVPVPEGYSERPAVLRWIGEPVPTEPPPDLLAIVRDMLAYEAAQFDGPPDHDLSVSGADLVDAFSAWREQLKRAVGGEG